MAWPPLRPLAPKPNSRASSSTTSKPRAAQVERRAQARQAATDHGHVAGRLSASESAGTMALRAAVAA
jgi:hypothetical protein